MKFSGLIPVSVQAPAAVGVTLTVVHHQHRRLLARRPDGHAQPLAATWACASSTRQPDGSTQTGGATWARERNALRHGSTPLARSFSWDKSADSKLGGIPCAAQVRRLTVCPEAFRQIWQVSKSESEQSRRRNSQ